MADHLVAARQGHHRFGQTIHIDFDRRLTGIPDVPHVLDELFANPRDVLLAGDGVFGKESAHALFQREVQESSIAGDVVQEGPDHHRVEVVDGIDDLLIGDVCRRPFLGNGSHFFHLSSYFGRTSATNALNRRFFNRRVRTTSVFSSLRARA
ncbi:hypothetical protein ACFYTQ_12930 [Nocardia sp. NPDC004068]|uniref:hypothetical protein n=1 Tax=Nocardia sp. NPDC004068 TaxID=3364303 RepID=UPI003691CA32